MERPAAGPPDRRHPAARAWPPPSPPAAARPPRPTPACRCSTGRPSRRGPSTTAPPTWPASAGPCARAPSWTTRAGRRPRLLAKVSGAELSRLRPAAMAHALRAAWADPRTGGLVGVDEIGGRRLGRRPERRPGRGPGPARARRAPRRALPQPGHREPDRARGPAPAARRPAGRPAGRDARRRRRGARDVPRRPLAVHRLRVRRLLDPPARPLGAGRPGRAAPPARAVRERRPGRGLAPGPRHPRGTGSCWPTAPAPTACRTRPRASTGCARTGPSSPTRPTRPPGGDFPVPVGGGLTVTPPQGRMTTVTLARPGRAVVRVIPAGGGAGRVVAKVDRPHRARRASPSACRPTSPAGGTA